jgi:hypothetical protein
MRAHESNNNNNSNYYYYCILCIECKKNKTTTTRVGNTPHQTTHYVRHVDHIAVPYDGCDRIAVRVEHVVELTVAARPGRNDTEFLRARTDASERVRWTEEEREIERVRVCTCVRVSCSV